MMRGGGAMAGGEWWRVDGPWRVLGRSGREKGEAESVYAPEVPVEPPAQKEPDAARLIDRAAPGLSAKDFPGWDSVAFDFPEAGPIPEQRVEETEGEVEAGAEVGVGVQPRAAWLAGRRPSVLVLVAALALVAGALTGQLIAMLAGWGLAYLTRLGDLTRKFAVLGIPLITMTGSTVWFWGRAQGRWGSPLAPGAQLSHETWAAAPAVLRLAAGLSALFLLAVTLRRRPNAQ